MAQRKDFSPIESALAIYTSHGNCDAIRCTQCFLGEGSTRGGTISVCIRLQVQYHIGSAVDIYKHSLEKEVNDILAQQASEYIAAHAADALAACI